MIRLISNPALCAVVFGLMAPQDQQPENEILSLGERFLGEAKEHYDKHEWLDAIELAERARTAFQAVAELYASQKRTADIKRPNELVTKSNQLIRLARDLRKAESEKATSPPAGDPKKTADPLPSPKESSPPPAEPAKLPQKLDLPAASSQEGAEKSIRDTFKAEYAKSAASDRQALARKLLKDGIETKADRAAQFVLFREASDLAVQAGDAQTAMAAIDEMGRIFAIDTLAVKVAMASKLQPANTHEGAEAAVNVCKVVAGEAVRLDQYDIASIVIKKAETLAKTPINISMTTQVQARASAILDLQKEYLKVKVADRTLADKPDDPASNLQVGRFYCFMKGDWQRGLPLLRKGADAVLSRIVETEVASPPGAELRLDLAEAWWALGEKESFPLAKSHLRARARYWYERALPELTGFPKTKVQTRLQEMEEEEMSRWSVNLLKLVDPKKDSVNGEWKLDGAVLMSPSMKFARLQLPFVPPEEYDLKLVVVPGPNHHTFVVGLVGGGRQFIVQLDGYENSDIGGLERVDGKAGRDNETSFRGRVFNDDKPKTILCSVRKARVTVVVEGKTLIDWKADYKRVGLWDWWSIPNKKVLYLAAGDVTAESMFQYQQIWFTPISGQGQKLR